MNRRPDVIRTLVMVFAVGLLISGITSLAASDNGSTPSAAQMSGVITTETSTARSN